MPVTRVIYHRDFLEDLHTPLQYFNGSLNCSSPATAVIVTVVCVVSEGVWV